MWHVNTAQSSFPRLEDVLGMSPDEFVARYADIAVVNLACAEGLPDTEDIDLPKYMAVLDQMATAAEARTEKSWRLFDLKPAEFNGSRNVFRIFMMEHVLRTQFGVKYDPMRSHIKPDQVAVKPPHKTYDTFIHGVLSDSRTGTCSSLPTFSVAVGRRLGYPLRLVRAPEHTFFRWDDGDEKFNVQHTPAGSEVLPDEHYHSWPLKWDQAMFDMNARTGVWLSSMTPKQEVSKFLCNRALSLCDVSRFTEAFEAIEAAERYDPKNPACTDIHHFIQDKATSGVVLPASDRMPAERMMNQVHPHRKEH